MMPNIKWWHLIVTVAVTCIVWQVIEHYWETEVEQKEILP